MVEGNSDFRGPIAFFYMGSYSVWWTGASHVAKPHAVCTSVGASQPVDLTMHLGRWLMSVDLTL